MTWTTLETLPDPLVVEYGGFPVGGPSSRRGWQQPAYDYHNDIYVIYGGSRGGDECWEVENLQWRRTKHGTDDPSKPPVKEHHILVYDPIRRQTILTHGWHMGAGGDPAKVWLHERNGQFFDSGIHAYRPGSMRNLMGAAACWCPPLNGIIIVPGNNWPDGTFLLNSSDLTVLDLGSIPSWGWRYDHQNHMVWSESLQEVIYFGGDARPSRIAQNDVHSYCPAINQWVLRSTSHPKPEPRKNCAVACSPNQLFVHGGRNDADTTLSDAWTLNLTTWEWTRLEESNWPQRHHAAFWDGAKYVLVAGTEELPTYSPDSTVMIQVPGGLEVNVV